MGRSYRPDPGRAAELAPNAVALADLTPGAAPVGSSYIPESGQNSAPTTAPGAKSGPDALTNEASGPVSAENTADSERLPFQRPLGPVIYRKLVKSLPQRQCPEQKAAPTVRITGASGPVSAQNGEHSERLPFQRPLGPVIYRKLVKSLPRRQCREQKAAPTPAQMRCRDQLVRRKKAGHRDTGSTGPECGWCQPVAGSAGRRQAQALRAVATGVPIHMANWPSTVPATTGCSPT